jgi:hypothetical protein
MRFLSKAVAAAALIAVAPSAAGAAELFEFSIFAPSQSNTSLDKPRLELKNASTAGELISSFKLSYTLAPGMPNAIIDVVDSFTSVGGVSPSIQRVSASPTNSNGLGTTGLEIFYVASTFQPTDTSRFRAEFDISGSNGSNVDFRSILFASNATGTVTFSNGTVQTFSLGAPSAREIYSYKTVAPTVAGVPEPASWAMMIGGLSIVGVSMRRRSHRNVQFA